MLPLSRFKMDTWEPSACRGLVWPVNFDGFACRKTVSGRFRPLPALLRERGLRGPGLCYWAWTSGAGIGGAFGYCRLYGSAKHTGGR